MNTKTKLIGKAQRLLFKTGKISSIGRFARRHYEIALENGVRLIFDMDVSINDRTAYFIDFVNDEISEETAKINQYKDMYCTEHNLGLIRIPKNIARLTTKLVVFE